ncbi:tol-pal system YbgF family protein [Spirillospora sp. NPDC048911]|uniref:tetratricopeptide repeat protein n=1 Tax=Spirillospora sp. NPDC048911 TaxID=3364527 RepID=UPI003715C116
MRASVPEIPRPGPGQVATIESMVQVFSDSDTTFGGGRARAALMAYLASDIAPWLRASIDRRLRRRLLSAATELTYLAGFMCFDDECHGLAQRYYRAALEMATANRDPAAYAVTLRAMSVQARALGHRRHAEHLAEVAVATSRGAARPVHQAFFWGQLAVATAAADNPRGAVSALSAAERHLDQATSSVTASADEAAMGGYHPAALLHQEAAVRALLGDGKGAITALSASIRHRPLSERRSRAILHARLAELHLDQGHLEPAIAAWQTFLADYPQLSSGRACTALDIMRSRLRPHGAHPAIRQLLARAAAA